MNTISHRTELVKNEQIRYKPISACCIAVLVLALCVPYLLATSLYERELPLAYRSGSTLISPEHMRYQRSSNDIETERLMESTNSDVSKISTNPSETISDLRVYPWQASFTSLINSETLVDKLCDLKNITRQSSEPDQILKNELVLDCDQVGEDNLAKFVDSIRRRKRRPLHQYHFTNSNPRIVSKALESTCRQFDCSRLSVFNVSGQQIFDEEKLALNLDSWPLLEILDLSNTSIDSIEYFWMSNSSRVALTHLYLDYNNISSLNLSPIVDRMPSLKHLSIINNTIYDIFCDVNLRDQVFDQLQTLSLANNSINCNKSQLWLLKHFRDQNLKFPDYDLIRCSSPENLIDMTWIQRVSVLETRICDDCDCRSLKRTAISVDCHNKNLTVLPDVLPINAKVLNLTSNGITSLGVPHNSKNWENVTYVHLENNLISSFQPLEINSKFMRNLAALDIRRNKFQEFPSHIFEQFINLDQVHLSNNPWLCDCESTFAFQEWLQRQFHKVGDKEEIKCGIAGFDLNGVKSINLEQRLSSRVIYRLSKSELCPQDGLEEPWHWLDAVNWGLGALILLILVKLTLDYIYQHKTKRLPHFFKLNF